MPTSLVIADIHLIAGEADKTNLFVKFCQQQAAEVDELFILGDLFNTWIGDDLSIAPYQVIVSALKTLSATTKVFIMAGNRDFLLATEFIKQTHCNLIKAPYLLKTKHQNYILTHGDELCTDDKNYQKLKCVLQHPITKFIFLHLPKKLRLKLSGQLRQKSIEAQQYKSRKIMDVNQVAVDTLMQTYSNVHLIHGHTHRQNTHISNDYTRYVLGDWHTTKGNTISIDEKGVLNWLEIN